MMLGLYSYLFLLFFFFKQKTAYEMRISDWSSDVCSSDLTCHVVTRRHQAGFDAVLGLEPVGDDLELQLTHGAQQKRTAGHFGAKYLDGPFLAPLGKAHAQLLGAQRILYLTCLKPLGCKAGPAGDLPDIALGPDKPQLQKATKGY